MVDYALISVIPSDESYREFGYQVKKAAEGAYITEIWGWDEAEQRDFFAEDWQQTRPNIITYKGQPIGTIYTKQSGGCLEIGRFFILPEYQNKGIGTHLLKDILAKADRLGLIAKLRYLRNNPAASLYLRHGFVITNFDETFYSMERKPTPRADK